jgi:hypothetical protein
MILYRGGFPLRYALSLHCHLNGAVEDGVVVRMRRASAQQKVKRILAKIRGGETPGKVDEMILFGPYVAGDVEPDYLGVAVLVDFHNRYTMQLFLDRHYHDTLARSMRGALKKTNNERVQVVMLGRVARDSLWSADPVRPLPEGMVEPYRSVWRRREEVWLPPSDSHPSWRERYGRLRDAPEAMCQGALAGAGAPEDDRTRRDVRRSFTLRGPRTTT